MRCFNASVGAPRTPAAKARLALALLGALLAACFAREVPVRPLRLESIRPRNVHGVYLNEDLVFTFSAEVDPESLVRRAVRIEDAAGRPARGDWFVEGKQLRFSPAPVRMRDLSDGGYRPGTRYTVEILGFPRLDAVRDVEGRPLDAGRVWSFETVAVAGERAGFVFEDASPAHAERLRLVRDRAWIGPEDPVLLECAEPIDPSSIHDEDFALIRRSESGAIESGSPPESFPPIELRVVVLNNQDEGEAPAGEACAVLALYPRRGPLALGNHGIRVAQPLRLRDFGGNAVPPPSSHESSIRVSGPGAEGARGQLHLSFLDDRLSSPLALPSLDGTAHWLDGSVTIRYPRAAGDGADGEVVLGSSHVRRDVQATRLSLARGTRYVMEGPGLRVLRAQGRIELSGDLERRDSGALEPYFVSRYQDGLPPELTGISPWPLSEWLQDALQHDPSWTIVIAGGDLVIDGSIRVDTPLLLVAGGSIRTSASRSVHLSGDAEDEMFLLGVRVGWDLQFAAKEADLLFIDPPVVNPLRVPLRYGVLSDPVPASGRISRWIDAYADGRPRAGQRSETGTWSLRFLPAGAPPDPALVRDHPQLLDRVSPVKLWIELEVQPGGMWNPPFLDFVRLSWEERDN